MADSDAVASIRQFPDSNDTSGQGALIRESTRHRRRWTQHEDSLVRDAFRKVKTIEIANRLSRTRSAVDQRALKVLLLPRVGTRPRGRRWERSDEEFLRENYGRTPAGQIATALSRTPSSIQGRASHLHLTRTTARRFNMPWTEVDERYLLANYGRSTLTEIASRLNRTSIAVRLRAYRPRWGVRPSVRARNIWSTSDDELLRANYGQVPTARLAQRLRRTVSSINCRAFTLGLTRHFTRSPAKEWRKDEDDFLRAQYGRIRPSEIGKRIGRTRPSIYHRAEVLGLAASLRSPEFLRRQSLPRTALPFTGLNSELDVGYVAGIVDGEGSITKPPNVALQVSMTTREVTEHLQTLCGGSVTGPYLGRSGRTEVCQPQYHWTVSSTEDVYRILKVLLPHLSVKRQKAEMVLQFLEERWAL